MSDQVYCVSFNFYQPSRDKYFLNSELIQNANSEAEALGMALENHELNDNMRVVDWKVKSFKPISDDQQYQDRIKEESFLELIDYSDAAIMGNAILLINDGHKINAIKFIRCFLKPYLSLLDCKKIIEQWEFEKTHDVKTSLLTLVKSTLINK